MEVKKAKFAKKAELPTEKPERFGYQAWGSSQADAKEHADHEIAGVIGDPIKHISIAGVGNIDAKRNAEQQVILLTIDDPNRKLVGGVHVNGGSWVPGKHDDDKLVLGCHIPFDQIWLAQA